LGDRELIFQRLGWLAKSATGMPQHAAADFSQAIAIVSPYSRDLPFLRSEKQECEKKMSK
jgi:hypothetical protein